MPRQGSDASFAAQLKNGTITPSELLKACIARLDEIDPKIGAFVHVAREAAQKAAAASDERRRKKQPLSPIDGMPIGIKDVIETADMPTGQGSPMWAGFQTLRDAASVQALREAGAVILGKTVTTEFAATEPLMATRNPHDPTRTAGGSSSGSAGAVGAGILPAGLGTQVVGSILRPASFCGCVGFKPTIGALNRSGSYDHLSQSCLGVLAATPEDAWVVASAIAHRVGGDPGYPGLNGPVEAPAAVAPRRLAVLETGGWKNATPGARAAFAAARKQLETLGVTLTDRQSDPDLDALERDITDAVELTRTLNAWETRWPLGTYSHREGLSDAMKERLDAGNKMTQDEYRGLLKRRQDIRDRYAALVARYDGFVSLGAAGAAPVGIGWTGNPAINVPASLLGVPAITLPLLADEGLPLGLQLLGRADGDADLFAAAEWVWRNYAG